MSDFQGQPEKVTTIDKREKHVFRINDRDFLGTQEDLLTLDGKEGKVTIHKDVEFKGACTFAPDSLPATDTEVEYTRDDGDKLNIAAGSDDVGSAINDLDDAIGALGDLDTTEKGTVVGAVNEVKGVADAAAPSADLASTSSNKGASLVGIADSGSLITATQVEAALAEIVKKANAGLAAPMTFEVDLSAVADADVVARFSPGVAGKIRKITAFASDPVTTAAKAATFTAAVAGTPTTGGALALTSAGLATKGAAMNGSAITAANAFTAAQEITVVASSVTAFVEGKVVICLFFDPAA